MKYFSLLIVAGVLSFSACKSGSNPPKSSGELLEEAASNMNEGAGKYMIETPKGWKRVDTTFNGIKATLLLAPDMADDFRPNINVVTENMRNDSLQAYFDKTVGTMQQYLEKFSVSDKGAKDINGMPARWVKYTAVQGGREVAAILYVVAQKGIAYNVTGITTQGREGNYFGVFEHAASTLSIAE